MYRGAILGFGQVVEFGHVPAFKEHAGRFEICAVADEREERLAKAREYFPAARTYNSLDAMLAAEKQLDFVVVATPPVFHPEAALKALKKGRHVLCEKPLVLNSRDFRKLSAAAGRKNLCLFTVHNWKKAPPIAKAHELVSGGEVGTVKYVELHVLRKQAAPTVSNGGNWRENAAMAGGGIMVDHGWHNFYLACFLAGSEPSTVSATLCRQTPETAEDDAIACITFKSGARAVIHLTWQSPARKNRIVVYGDRGYLEVQDDTVVLEQPGKEPQIFRTGEKLSGGSAHPTWMSGLLKDFADELDGVVPRGHNLREAGYCLALTEGGYRSALRGRVEKLAF